MPDEGPINQLEQPGNFVHLTESGELRGFRDQISAAGDCRLHPSEACSAFEFVRSTFYWSMMAWARNWDMDNIAVSASDNGARNPGEHIIA